MKRRQNGDLSKNRENMMKARLFLLGIVLAAVMVTPALKADSIIADSTFGLFTDDVDDYMDVNDYEGVEFDNAFIYLKGGRNGTGVQKNASGWFDQTTSGFVNDNEAGIQGGFATWFFDYYLGFRFDTNLWDGDQTITRVDGDQKDTLSSNTNMGIDPWNTPATGPNKGIAFDGAFELLLGTGNIGAFTLGLDFDHVSLKNEKEKDGNPEELSYSDGALLIDLGWGKNFEVKGGILAPEFHIGYQISTFKVETKSDDSFSYFRYWDEDQATWIDDDYFEKMSHLLIGANAEYTSPSEAHWFGVYYGLDIGLHPATIEKNPVLDKEIDWKGYWVSNGLEGGYKRSVELNDRFSLAFGANLGLELVTSREDYTDRGDPLDGVEFIVNPEVLIGSVYTFAKKPFALYTGLRLDSFGASGDENFYSLKYENEKTTKTETYTHEFRPWGLSAGLGLSFTPFENFALDLGLSQNLSYYLSDKLEYVWAYDILDWEHHPFTAELQVTFKF
jgi:hypothetical protein